MSLEVFVSPEAKAHLEAVEDYIAQAASPQIAANYVDAILQYCASLDTFPHRGTRRDDIRPGMRIIGFRKRVTITFEVTDRVTVLGIFYAGRNFETNL